MKNEAGETHNYLIFETRDARIEIRFEHIEQLAMQEESQQVRLVYFVSDTNIFGITKKDMKKVLCEFECFESDLLLKTYQSVRNKMY